MTRLFFALLLSAVTAAGHYVCASPRWSEQKAKEWAEASPWFCGFNYIPANAINYTAMWDKTGFSPDVIDRELALAEEIGLNCARVVLQYAVYEDNPRYFLRTFDRFLAMLYPTPPILWLTSPIVESPGMNFVVDLPHISKFNAPITIIFFITLSPDNILQ